MAWEDPATPAQRKAIARLAFGLGINEAIEHDPEIKTRRDAHNLICRLEKQAHPKPKKEIRTPQMALF